MALRARALTRGGAAAAFAVGTLTFGAGKLAFTLVLLAFFIPSVLLSRLGRTRKRALVDVGKAGPRDAAQVLANGGVATVCALAWAYHPTRPWAGAFAGAYAAATADTWATELGTLARQAPRSILSLRPIAAGLSGGVTLAGTLAEVAGALWLAAAAPAAGLAVTLHAVALGGVAGATLDSVLGASVQELRRCERCGRACETDPHACGGAARLVRGVRGCSNDVVNFAATLGGAVAAYLLS